MSFGRVLGLGALGVPMTGASENWLNGRFQCLFHRVCPLSQAVWLELLPVLYKHGMELAFWRMRVRGIRLARSKLRGPFFRPERCSSIESRRFRKPVDSYPNTHRGPEPAPPPVEELRYHVEPIRFHADGQGAAVPVLPDVGAQRCREVSLSTFRRAAPAGAMGLSRAFAPARPP